MAYRRQNAGLLLLLALAALAMALPAGTQAAYPGANGKIAYVSNNGGADTEIMAGNIDGSGSVQLTNDTADDKDPAWSPDGKKIAYAHFQSATGHFQIWTMNADGSGQTPVWFNSTRDYTEPTWSPNESQIAFQEKASATNDNILRGNADGSCCATAVANNAAANERDPAWSPVDASQILFSYSTGGAAYSLRTIDLTTLAQTPILSEAGRDFTRPAWAPDGNRIAYTYDFGPDDDIRSADPNGANQLAVATTSSDEHNPAYAPTNNMLAYDVSGADTEIAIQNLPAGAQNIMEVRGATTDTNPDWQPIVDAQVRVQGATPAYLPLVPAFKDCISPNKQHDPPLGAMVCVPPQPGSGDLTVGEPQVNGKPTKFSGFVRIKSVPGDLQFETSLSDVRCARRNAAGKCPTGPLGDYTGNLTLRYDAHIIDRAVNGRAGTGQSQSFTFPPGVPCTSTADTTVGSTCSLTTSINTITPGAIVAGKRAIWSYDRVRLEDSAGAAFAQAGNFVP